MKPEEISSKPSQPPPQDLGEAIVYHFLGLGWRQVLTVLAWLVSNSQDQPLLGARLQAKVSYLVPQTLVPFHTSES